MNVFLNRLKEMLTANGKPADRLSETEVISTKFKIKF
jgi:hypothetical protein